MKKEHQICIGKFSTKSLIKIKETMHFSEKVIFEKLFRLQASLQIY